MNIQNKVKNLHRFTKFDRTRIDSKANYVGVFKNLVSFRFRIDPNIKIGSLNNPELLDYAINSWCSAGCNFCSVSATKQGTHFDNVVTKLLDLHGNQDLNDRPFQVAYGGAGEPTAHPDFLEVIKTTYNLQIVPNYTTNGLHVTDELLEVTANFCGGVAISCHPHLTKIWSKSFHSFVEANCNVCLHIIVGEKGSSERFWRLYDQYSEECLYIVALPYMVAGRAKNISVEEEWHIFFKEYLSRANSEGIKDIALGANFHSFLMKHPEYRFSYSIYDPELLSGYRLLDDSYKMIRKSSYDPSPKIIV